MIYDSWDKVEKVFVESIEGSYSVKNPREKYDIDGMGEACACTVERDGVEVTVWDVPDDHDKFCDLVRFYAYPSVDESGEGQFKVKYHVFTEWDENGDPVAESVTEFTGTLREIIKDVMSKENLHLNYNYNELVTGVTDEHGNPVQGWRWFVEKFENFERSRVTDPDEAQFNAWRGKQCIMLHRYPMPVYPLAVELFFDKVYLKFHDEMYFCMVQYAELERV